MITRAGLALALLVLTEPRVFRPGEFTEPRVFRPGGEPQVLRPGAPGDRSELARDLDAILASSTFARTLTAIRVESLRTGDVLYAVNSDKLVVPASNLKLLTLAVAADRLGWDYRFETRLEAAGTIKDGALAGDLIVTGSGDPTILSGDRGHAPLFLEWADALRAAGIQRVDGRLIGDDNAFDDDGLGAGWAWDYLGEAYAARSGALTYNENIAVLQIAPGAASGDPAIVIAAPPGTGLEIDNQVTTGARGERRPVTVARLAGSAKLRVSGAVPVGAPPMLRGASVDNPTKFFVEGLRLALLERGIAVSGGAWDIDEAVVAGGLQPAGSAPRQLIARRESLPLSSLGAQLFRVSQNVFGENIFKALGRTSGAPGSTATAREVVRTVLTDWGISPDSYVMHDGSGLSRYAYATADTIVAVLRRVWFDERLRGPYVTALPIGAIDGTLENRLKDPTLARRVQAKTGNLTNMRALSGYLDTDAGEKLVFTIIVNNHTAPGAEVDAAFERILIRLTKR